jgi:acyl dehydratase
MAVDFEALDTGQELSDKTYVLDAPTVERYIGAVGDRSGMYQPTADRPVVPVMALAALGLRGVVADLGIPDGTVHAGQELEFSGAVRIGDVLRCRAVLSQNAVRGETRLVSLQLSVEDGGGRQVMSGKTTLLMALRTLGEAGPGQA